MESVRFSVDGMMGEWRVYRWMGYMRGHLA